MSDELAQHLDSLARDDCYRVDAVLKRSPSETTQRVYFVGANGSEQGPYVRKYLEGDGSEPPTSASPKRSARVAGFYICPASWSATPQASGASWSWSM